MDRIILYLLPDGRGHNYAENIWMSKIASLNSSPYVKIFRDCKTFVYDAICSIFKLKEF